MDSKPNLGALYGADADTTSFLHLATCADLDTLMAPVAILGAPAATPYASVGAYCRNAPDALRQATGVLTANVDRHDFDHGGPVFPMPAKRPVDCGNLAFSETDSAANRASIRDAVGRINADGIRGATRIL